MPRIGCWHRSPTLGKAMRFPTLFLPRDFARWRNPEQRLKWALLYRFSTLVLPVESPLEVTNRHDHSCLPDLSAQWSGSSCPTRNGNLSMRVTVSFGNPFAALVYTAALLMIGWANGAHWGHTISAAWMVFFVTILLLLHDAAIAIFACDCRNQGRFL